MFVAIELIRVKRSVSLAKMLPVERGRRPVAALSVAVATRLPADRRGCPSQLPADRPHTLLSQKSVGDHDPLLLTEVAHRTCRRRPGRGCHGRIVQAPAVRCEDDAAVTPACPGTPVHPDQPTRFAVTGPWPISRTNAARFSVNGAGPGPRRPFLEPICDLPPSGVATTDGIRPDRTSTWLYQGHRPARATALDLGTYRLPSHSSSFRDSCLARNVAHRRRARSDRPLTPSATASSCGRRDRVLTCRRVHEVNASITSGWPRCRGVGLSRHAPHT